MNSINNDNCFYFPSEQFSYALGDLQLPTEPFVNFDNVLFQEDTETSSVASSFQKASKKISKASGEEGSKKVMRKKHNRARNPWTPQEDIQLVELMKKHGQSWAMISAAMEGRTGKQIRDRFLNKLRPNIKCGDWKPEEDELMIKLLNEIGNRWSLIATHLPGRTEGQVKNRYYSCIKKRLETNGAFSQTSVTRTTSEAMTSVATSPEVEEAKFDFGYEFDVNMMNGCATFLQEPTLKTQVSEFFVSRGPRTSAEEIFSEEGMTQCGNPHMESPFQYCEPTSAGSCGPVNNLFFGQPQSTDSFYLPSIENDSQIDDMLNKVTSYFMEQPSSSSDVDAYFADDLRSDNNSFSSFDMENDKLSQLSKRKAYLELALAKTLKEIKNL